MLLIEIRFVLLGIILHKLFTLVRLVLVMLGILLLLLGIMPVKLLMPRMLLVLLGMPQIRTSQLLIISFCQ